MTIKDNVELILSEDELSRGSDKRLMLQYWKHIDGINFQNFESEFMDKATPIESVTRARRIVQEEGNYLPNEYISNKRKSRQDLMKKSIIADREVI